MHEVLEVVERTLLVQVEKQEERVALGGHVALADEDVLDVLYAIFYDVQTKRIVDCEDAHDRITAHVAVPMLQVSNHSVDQVLDNLLN